MTPLWVSHSSNGNVTRPNCPARVHMLSPPTTLPFHITQSASIPTGSAASEDILYSVADNGIRVTTTVNGDSRVDTLDVNGGHDNSDDSLRKAEPQGVETTRITEDGLRKAETTGTDTSIDEATSTQPQFLEGATPTTTVSAESSNSDGGGNSRFGSSIEDDKNDAATPADVSSTTHTTWNWVEDDGLRNSVITTITTPLWPLPSTVIGTTKLESEDSHPARPTVNVGSDTSSIGPIAIIFPVLVGVTLLVLAIGGFAVQRQGKAAMASQEMVEGEENRTDVTEVSLPPPHHASPRERNLSLMLPRDRTLSVTTTPSVSGFGDPFADTYTISPVSESTETDEVMDWLRPPPRG